MNEQRNATRRTAAVAPRALSTPERPGARQQGVSGIALLVALALFALLSRALGAAPPSTLSSLSGRVVDGAGRPLAGAEILLGSQTPSRRGDEVEQVFRARSAVDGLFRFATLPHGRIGWVVARHAGFAQAVRGLSLQPLAPLRVVLRPGREVSGIVVDEAGRPLAGIEVEARMLLDLGSAWVDSLPPELREGLRLSTRTGADGSFRFAQVASGGLALQFRGDAYTPLRAPAREIPAGAGTSLLGRFTLAAGGHLEGRVTDRQGAPLAGVQVRRMGIADELSVHASWHEAWTRHPALLTDGDGHFALDGLPQGATVTLEFCAQRYRSPEALTGLYELPGAPLSIVLEPREAKGGVYRLEPRERERQICPEPEDDLPAAASGAPAAPLQTLARSAASAPPVALPAGETELDLKLRRSPTPTLRGRALDERGRPLAGVLLRNDGAVHSGADGTFVLPLDPFADFLLASKAGYASWSYPGDFLANHPANLTLRMRRGTTLTGRVTGLSAADLARVQIEVERVDGTLAHGLAPDGTFRFDGLPSRRVEITAHTGSRIAKLDLREIAPGPGGRDSDAPVEIAFAPLFPLQGRVLDAQGAPIVGAIVEANSELASRGSDRTASRSDGSFTLHLPATRFSLRVTKGEYGEIELREVVVADGSGTPAERAPTPQPLEIRLGPARP